MSVITSEELYAFYAELGEAVHSLQLVEGVLHHFLSIRIDFQKKRPSAADAEQTLERYRSTTLGGLIRIASENGIIAGPLLQSLESLNEERRFVVHRLQEQTNERLRADAAFRGDLSERLQFISDRAYEVHRELTVHLVRRFGPALSNTEAFRSALSEGLAKRGFGPALDRRR